MAKEREIGPLRQGMPIWAVYTRVQTEGEFRLSPLHLPGNLSKPKGSLKGNHFLLPVAIAGPECLICVRSPEAPIGGPAVAVRPQDLETGYLATLIEARPP